VNSEPEVPARPAGSERAPGDADDAPYCYQDSGIRERHGRVPLWLWAVVAGLTIWGVYYTIAYWSPRP
jgi:hypothetical protein